MLFYYVIGEDSINIEKSHLNEIFILRAVAALSVVLLHTIKHIIDNNFGGSTSFEQVLLSLSGFLSFGTPAFVCISIILFAYKYPNKLPFDFYQKRVSAILIPFLFMAIFYAVLSNISSPGLILKGIFYNIMGYYHGWFVLLIFQFYVLYHLFISIDNKLNPKIVLVSSLIINILYLSLFNFSNVPNSSEFTIFVWKQGFWVPFLGWFFYFTFAYYCGKNYNKFLNTVRKYQPVVWCCFIISIVIILINNYYNLFNYGSKRVDMILFTLSIVTLILYLFSNVKKVNFIINIISKYSFGIYLLHMFFLILFKEIFKLLNVHPGYWAIPFWFAGSIIASIISVYLVNKIPFGKYLVGGINDPNKKRKEKRDMLQHGQKKMFI